MGDLFQPGDVVTLKSGGPHMTVISMSGNLASVVYWRDRDQDFKTTDFEGFLLKKS